jgi:ribonuclease T2
MQRSQRAITSIIVLVLALGATALERWTREPQGNTATKGDPAAKSSAGFDYYLISLSWSPTFCESNPGDTEQCGNRGYGFILHGLWPQYERGNGPQDCASDQRPDRATIARTLAFMPSRRLIEHEWRAHGACTDLDPEAYFGLADRAFASIHVPDALRPPAQPPSMSADDVSAAFVRANPGLGPNMLSVNCSSRDLAEVRICVDTDLQPRACGSGVRTRCPRDLPLRIPLVR